MAGIVGTVVGVLIGVFLNSKFSAEAAPDWYLELFDQLEAYCLTIRFSGEIILGRGIPSLETDGVFPISRAPTMGRAQCRLVEQDGQLMIQNLGQVNPTWHNGVCLYGDSPTALRKGDWLQVGRQAFLVQELKQLS